MSRRACGASIIALTLTTAGLLRAQTTAEWQQRLERLGRVASQMADTARTLARHQQALVPVDTIKVGALVVLAPHSASRRVRPAADSAWRTLSRFFGDRASAVGNIHVLVHYEGQPEGDIPAGPLNAIPVAIPAGVETGVTAEILVNWVEPEITKDADSSLRAWVLNTHSFKSARPALVYEELATSPWGAVRECFLGQIASCRLALGISGDDPALNWFDASDRRHYVRRMVPRLTLPTMYDDCTRSGDDSACIRLMRLPIGTEIAPPFSVHVRQLLLSIAIEAGGSGAFERLIRTIGQPLDVRLAAAAGLPIDSLVSRWRARVLSAHPKTVAADERAAWAAVGWGVLLIAVALRSSKWR